MPKQFYADGPFVLHQSMDYDEFFAHFIFLDQKDFDAVRTFIDTMADAFNDANDERNLKTDGN